MNDIVKRGYQSGIKKIFMRFQLFFLLQYYLFGMASCSSAKHKYKEPNEDAYQFSFTKVQEGYNIDGITFGNQSKKAMDITIPTYYQNEPILKVVFDTGTIPSNLEEVSIQFEENSQVKMINKKAFSIFKDKIVSLKLPQSVEEIQSDSFADFTKIKELTLPSLNTYIGDYFGSRSADGNKLSVPSTLKKVTILSGNIPDFAFSECKDLITIEIPDDATVIGEQAFSYCTSLEQVILSKNSQLETIKRYAFINCKALKEMTIPKSVNTIGANAFSFCSLLETINFATDSQLVAIEDSAFSCCTSLVAIEMPSSVKTIGEYAFYGCELLKEIHFDANSQLIRMGEYAFRACFSLISIEIPKGVKEINNYTFLDCTALNEVNFATDSQLESIHYHAFENCTSLTSIVILRSVITIEREAFVGCTSLTIYCETGSQSEQWENGWDSNRPIYWENEWNYDENHHPQMIA